MARRKTDERTGSTTTYRDARGRVVVDPAEAVSGEVVRVDDHGLTRRTRFFMQPGELSWLPVSEAAFLLWVLLVFVLIWMGIGLFLVFS